MSEKQAAQITEDAEVEKCIQLLLLGKTYRAIAAQVDRSISWVHTKVKAALNEAANRKRESAERFVTIKLLQLDRVIEYAFDSYLRSRQPKTKKIIRKSRKGESTHDETINRDGDPRFLQTVEKAIALQVKMLGLDKNPAFAFHSDRADMLPVLVQIKSREEAIEFDELKQRVIEFVSEQHEQQVHDGEPSV